MSPPIAPARARGVLDRAQAEPGWYVRTVLGAELWSRQAEIVESVREHRKTAVRSGHGVGKTFTAAVASLWWLYAHPGSRVITTATTFYQVRDQLWREIARRHSAPKFRLGGECLQTRLELEDGRFAVGLSTKPEHREAFQGHHDARVLFVFDEASGIPREIFEAAEGSMTTAEARWLLIGNPTRPDGEFFDAFHSKRDEYHPLHIPCSDAPSFTGEQIGKRAAAGLVTREWVEERRAAWGEGSPLWDIKVLGNFPAQAGDGVIALAVVEQAQAQELPVAPDAPAVIGCDVARFGDDETVIAERVGDRVRVLEVYTGKDLMQTAGHVLRWHRKLGGRVVIDDTGLGGGVTDRLREQGCPAEAFTAGQAALDADQYPNARSELWFSAADQIAELDLPAGDERLAADLVAPLYKVDSRARRVVEPKEQTKKRLGRSPDRGDAVLLTMAPDRGVSVEIW